MHRICRTFFTPANSPLTFSQIPANIASVSRPVWVFCRLGWYEKIVGAGLPLAKAIAQERQCARKGCQEKGAWGRIVV